MSSTRHSAVATLAVLAVSALAGCSGSPAPSPSPSIEPQPTTGVWSPNLGDVDAAFEMLARTANYSSLDHSPVEGAWNYPLEERGFEAIADAGFTAIRLPVRFSAHQQTTAPYTIDEAFLERVDWAIDQALSNGLAVIIDNHHWGVEGRDDFDTLFTDPASQKDRLEAIWVQVGERYADQPVGVVFEIMNEPHAALDAVWNEYQADALAVIRATNPDRAVIIGPGAYNSPFALEAMDLSEDDNLIVTFHDYVPFNFTHQGATWVGEIPPVGVVWPDPALRLDSTWSDWSWDMDHTPTAAGIEVQAHAEWAGLYFHSDLGIEGATRIDLTVAETTELWIDCRFGDETESVALHTTAQAGVPLAIDTAACGLTGADLHDIRIMVGTNESTHFTVTQVTVTSAAGVTPLLVTSEEETMAPLDVAAAWSAAHGNVPMFMGEFSSSHLADQDSRDAWTRAVRGRAEELGIAWAYFDFQGDWGMWTPEEGLTRQWLLEALFGG